MKTQKQKLGWGKWAWHLSKVHVCVCGSTRVPVVVVRRRFMTHSHVCSLCATLNSSMKAHSALVYWFFIGTKIHCEPKNYWSCIYRPPCRGFKPINFILIGFLLYPYNRWMQLENLNKIKKRLWKSDKNWPNGANLSTQLWTRIGKHGYTGFYRGPWHKNVHHLPDK